MNAIMSDRVETEVLIVGAGITGLSTAHFLAKRGLGVHILEKEKRAGGTIASERVGGFLFEHGPNSTLDTTLIHDVFRDVGLEASVEYANERAKNRYVVRDGRLNSLPMNPVAFSHGWATPAGSDKGCGPTDQWPGPL